MRGEMRGIDSQLRITNQFLIKKKKITTRTHGSLRFQGVPRVQNENLSNLKGKLVLE